jgi:hypothetical protein
MQLVIKMTLDNEAMQEGSEIARILRVLGDLAEENGTHMLRERVIWDVNGNAVGSAEISGD